MENNEKHGLTGKKICLDRWMKSSLYYASLVFTMCFCWLKISSSVTKYSSPRFPVAIVKQATKSI